MRIGSQLRDSTIVRNLVKKIGFLNDEGEKLTEIDSREPIPFMFLDGSSGMGKTQMAFTLMSREEFRVHYFVCSQTGQTAQPIYKRYENISTFFVQCIQSDTETPEFSSGSYRFISSRACGFIVALITGEKQLKPMTLGEGAKKIHTYLKGADKKPQTNIIFLDEFPQLGNKNLEYLRWMRNIFRNLHLVTICSSTSSSVANLIGASASSRDSDDPIDWCYVFPRFPKVLNISGSTFSEFQKYVFSHSRPLFSATLQKTLLEDPGMDISDLCGSLGKRIHRMKMRYNEHFAHGQICLLLATSHIEYETNSPDMLSSSHFINLVENKFFLLQIESGNLFKKGSGFREEWKASLAFPNPKDDILLFLCLMGNKGYYPICEFNSTNRIPFRKSFKAIKFKGCKNRGSLIMGCGNPLVRTNTGLELEAMSTAVISLSSHYEGLNGIKFEKFLSHVLYEFECLESSSDAVLCRNEYYKGFDDIVIPFLSAPSVSWPDEIYGFSYNFCNLWRTLNEERIDFRTDSFDVDKKKRILSGECKDWNDKLSRKEVEKILVRIPHDSIIHLVFTRTMRSKYYKPKPEGKTYESFVKENPQLEKKLILRYQRESKELVPISGIPMNNLVKADGLVLFICIDADDHFPKKKRKIAK